MTCVSPRCDLHGWLSVKYHLSTNQRFFLFVFVCVSFVDFTIWKRVPQRFFFAPGGRRSRRTSEKWALLISIPGRGEMSENLEEVRPWDDDQLLCASNPSPMKMEISHLESLRRCLCFVPTISPIYLYNGGAQVAIDHRHCSLISAQWRWKSSSWFFPLLDSPAWFGPVRVRNQLFAFSVVVNGCHRKYEGHHGSSCGELFGKWNIYSFPKDAIRACVLGEGCVCVWGGGDLRECGVNFPGRNRSLIRPPFYHLLFIFWWKEPQQHLAARSLCLSLHASLSAPCCCQAVCLFVCLPACMPFCLAAYAPAVSVTLSTACLPGTHFIILPFLVFSHVDFSSP